jgi:hypothetical protein
VGIILPGLSSGASLLLLSYFQVILENSPALASVKMMPWTVISVDLVNQLRTSFNHVFVAGLDRNMLAIGLVYLICGVVVVRGLRRPNQLDQGCRPA